MVRTVSESCWRVLVAYESTTEESESRCKQGTSDETALGLTVGGGGPIVWRRDKVDTEQSGPEPSENEEGVFVGGGLAVRLDFFPTWYVPNPGFSDGGSNAPKRTY